jgi:hypothetical protein
MKLLFHEVEQDFKMNSELVEFLKSGINKDYYYPTGYNGCNPIHEVKNWDYVDQLITDLKNGDKITPILIDGPLHGGNMLTGTHRSAVNDVMQYVGNYNLIIPVISLQDLSGQLYDDIMDALDNGNYDTVDILCDRDYNNTLYKWYYGIDKSIIETIK